MTLSPHPEWWDRAKPDIDRAISNFVARRRDSVEAITPRDVIGKKNPFLFRARAPVNPDQLAKRLIDAFLSSSEETLFGETFEAIAVAICREAKRGRKSGITGIDLEYDEGPCRNLVQVKSSSRWGNSSQRKKLKDNFRNATTVLVQGNPDQQVKCIEGICYGLRYTRYTGTHWKFVGNDFWDEISGWPGTGRAVFNVVGQNAANGTKVLIRNARENLVAELEQVGAVQNGQINWDTFYDLIMERSRRKKTTKTKTASSK